MGDIVYRTSETGEITASMAPKKSRTKSSKAQLENQERFTLARQYGSQAKDEPVYQAQAKKTRRSASRIAHSDWSKGPVIRKVFPGWGGFRIAVHDNVHVARVRVTITDEQGEVLEQGEARHLHQDWWVFETKNEGTLLVEAWDLAGNLARLEA
jgi:hypothetical protein